MKRKGGKENEPDVPFLPYASLAVTTCWLDKPACSVTLK